MTAKEISQIVESYIKEYQEYNIDENIIFKDLYKTLFELKTQDIDTYYQLDKLSYVDQAKILQEYLHEKYHADIIIENEEQLGNIFLNIIGFTGAVIGTVAFLKSNFQKKLTYNIAKKLNIIGNFLKNISKSWSLRYKIIQNNASKCYHKCGVDINNLGDGTYIGTGGSSRASSSILKYTYDYDDVERGECMTECFLDTLIESIKLLFLNYIACLRQTNQYFKYENLNKDELEIAISKIKIDGPCENFRKEVSDAIDLFYEIIDYRYSNDNKFEYNQKVSEYRKRLSEALITARNSKEKPSGNFNFKKNN